MLPRVRDLLELCYVAIKATPPPLFCMCTFSHFTLQYRERVWVICAENCDAKMGRKEAVKASACPSYIPELII